jgi:hypothetical protein
MRHFFSQIRRDIPVEMFRYLVRTIKSCWRPSFCDPNCYVVERKKMTVVSFQSILAVSQLKNSSVPSVWQRYKVTWNGDWGEYCKDHLTKLLVSETKDFALI